jgi:hypothetical protein
MKIKNKMLTAVLEATQNGTEDNNAPTGIYAEQQMYWNAKTYITLWDITTSLRCHACEYF